MQMHHDKACVCTRLRRATRAVGKVYDDALAASDMTTAQYAILRHIARGEPLPLSRLAEQLVLDRTSLYRALTPIIAKGWIAVAPGQGKAKLASLTAEGRAVLQRAVADWDAVQDRIIAAMGEEQWAALEAALNSVTDIAQGAH